jgi:hypothetical protein
MCMTKILLNVGLKIYGANLWSHDEEQILILYSLDTFMYS